MRISDKTVEEHLDALERLGPKAAAARADADFLTEMLKTVHAKEYLSSDLPRAADKEAEAFASDSYQEALHDRRKAFVVAETLRHEKAWRERVIDAWQTMSANNRGKI